MNHTLSLTDDELRLLRAALHSYLDDFGHEEADVLRQIKELIAKLPTPGVPDEYDGRLLLWNLADSMTTLDELRAKLPDAARGRQLDLGPGRRALRADLVLGGRRAGRAGARS